MLELESRVMKRLSYLSKTYKNPATNERHMNGTERRDSDRGSKSPFFTYYSFGIFFIFCRCRFGVGLGFFIPWIWYYSLCFRNRLRPHSLRWIGSYILFTQTKIGKQIINFNCWMPRITGILIVVIDPRLGYLNHLFPSILASDLA